MENKDFIGVYPNAVSPETCNRIIDHYEHISTLGLSQPRKAAEQTRYIDKDNDTYFVPNTNDTITDLDHWFVQEFVSAFWRCYEDYQRQYGVLESLAKIGFTGKFKIQKTQPSGGYHVWHCEQGNNALSGRVLLVILYLNDVEEGGETEFLYQSKRVAAKQGTMLICPGGFTHTHRGNPPLTGDKYIMNTWAQFLE